MIETNPGMESEDNGILQACIWKSILPNGDNELIIFFIMNNLRTITLFKVSHYKTDIQAQVPFLPFSFSFHSFRLNLHF